jgi:hypothetical protein
MHQMTGLPVQILSGVVGQARHSAMSGQTAGRGATRAIATIVRAAGIPHHRSKATGRGRTAAGTKSHKPTGG